MNNSSLYSRLILDYSRSDAHRRPVPHATHTLEGVNPSCGDDITLMLRVEDGVIAQTGFLGSGCAISQASAAIMADLVQGKTPDEAQRLTGLFLRMVKGELEEDSEELDELGDAVALTGIRHTPARVKCAVLAWHTLAEALSGKGEGDPEGKAVPGAADPGT